MTAVLPLQPEPLRPPPPPLCEADQACELCCVEPVTFVLRFTDERGDRGGMGVCASDVDSATEVAFGAAWPMDPCIELVPAAQIGGAR